MAHAKHGPRQLCFCLGHKDTWRGRQGEWATVLRYDGQELITAKGGVSLLTLLGLFCLELSKWCSRKPVMLEDHFWRIRPGRCDV